MAPPCRDAVLPVKLTDVSVENEPHVASGATQICQPVAVVLKSEYHVMVVSGETTTPSGPEVDSYRTPSISMKSNPASVSKLGTESTIFERWGVMVHASSLP